MPPTDTSQSTIGRPPAELDKSGQPDATRRPVILMVESDDPTIELYRRVLNQEYEVITRGDEDGVMEVLSSVDLQAIILEPAVGGGRGWNIFTTIQKNLQAQPIPVVICSTLDERKRGLGMGAAAYLVKPVLPIALVETIHQIQSTKRIG